LKDFLNYKEDIKGNTSLTNLQ